MTGIRTSLSALRVGAEINDRLRQMGLPTQNFGGLVCIDTGVQCNFAGEGRIYENFKATGRLYGYTGFGSNPVQSSSQGYEDAPLREVSFADTFANSTSKVHTSEYLL